jgi:dCMP deaminase
MPVFLLGVLMEARPSYDEYFMEMAHVVAKRSTCLRRKVGAILVKEKHILSTGYNGAPKGMRHCSETGCLRENMNIPSGERHELCRGLHAEQNAIIQAAVFGISIKGSVLYCTNTPCVVCVKMLINAGVMEIICAGDYPDNLAKLMMDESGLKIKRFK